MQVSRQACAAQRYLPSADYLLCLCLCATCRSPLKKCAPNKTRRLLLAGDVVAKAAATLATHHRRRCRCVAARLSCWENGTHWQAGNPLKWRTNRTLARAFPSGWLLAGFWLASGRLPWRLPFDSRQPDQTALPIKTKMLARSRQSPPRPKHLRGVGMA